MRRNNKHILSIEWQNWKFNQPNLTDYQISVLIGMILSDASIIKTGKHAYVKFEQGQAQKEFIETLFNIFKTHCFQEEISVRLKNNKIHSYGFKTFSHPTLDSIYDLFYKGTKVKTIFPNFILNHVNEIVLAYWIMGDGSLHKRDKIYTLHTGGFSYNECILISTELNNLFNLNSSVKIAKKNVNRVSYMIVFKAIDSQTIKTLIEPHVIDLFKYKIDLSR